MDFPQRIVCLTEESVETLFALGKGHLIVGVSAYVQRPAEARKIMKVSVFTHAQCEKIVQLKPDLVLGFSDIQKDIAQKLIGEGLNVFIANHRDIAGIFNYVLLLGSMVGEREKAQQYIAQMREHLQVIRQQALRPERRPRVYFEEWDSPQICGIKWVSELIQWCGGEDIGNNYAQSSLAPGRIVSSEFVQEQNPDIIFACWCGKAADIPAITQRPGWQEIAAVKNGQVFELPPEIFLQPGPACIVDGASQLLENFQRWDQRNIKRF